MFTILSFFSWWILGKGRGLREVTPSACRIYAHIVHIDTHWNKSYVPVSEWRLSWVLLDAGQIINKRPLQKAYNSARQQRKAGNRCREMKTLLISAFELCAGSWWMVALLCFRFHGVTLSIYYYYGYCYYGYCLLFHLLQYFAGWMLK